MKNKKSFSFEQLYNTAIKEMSADGGVAGFQAPLGDETNKKLFKKEADESDNKGIDKTFEAGDYTITRSFRGSNKGYTLMVQCKKDKGKTFLNDTKVQALVNYLNKGK